MGDKWLMYVAKKRHILYDTQHPFYKNIIKQEEVWQEIVDLLGVTNQ